MQQKYPVETTPHMPRYYICGVFVPQEQDWIGKFAATGEELMEYGYAAGLDGREFSLVYHMIETQAIYEDWWYRTRRSP